MKLPYHGTPTKVGGSPLQTALTRWLIEALGMETLMDRKARAMRVLEEAVELAQAAGITVEKVQEQVSWTFGRPAGEYDQEIAGVINSALLAAEGYGQDGLWLGAKELRRAWRNIDIIRHKNLTKVQAD